MNDTSRMTAWAQILLAFVLVVGVLAIMFLLLLRPVALPQQNLTLVTSILGSFTTMAVAAGAYFFARHRPVSAADAPQDPASTPTQAPQAPK